VSDLAARFYERVAIEHPSKCWEWTLCRTDRGYGKFSIKGKNHRAHRVAWALWHGREVPDDLLVLHSCDNPPCCNPYHLRLGTNADNARDAAERQRWRPVKGEQHWNVKLTDEQIAEIRGRPSSQTGRSLAIEFGVSPMAISRYRSGKRRVA
jgi:HNH endonuclease